MESPLRIVLQRDNQEEVVPIPPDNHFIAMLEALAQATSDPQQASRYREDALRQARLMELVRKSARALP
jgi:hypothetical protein